MSMFIHIIMCIMILPEAKTIAFGVFCIGTQFQKQIFQAVSGKSQSFFRCGIMNTLNFPNRRLDIID